MANIEHIAELSRRITGVTLSGLAESDDRADCGRRDIACTRDSIVIRRSVKGIAMQIDIPARGYKGVALSAVMGAESKPAYRISMPHKDPALAIVLYEAFDDRDVIAIWKAWSNYFGLARVVERPSGEIEPCGVYYGPVAMGEQPLWRRRGGSLDARKPTQRSRRRNAHAILKPFVAQGNGAAIAES